MDHVVWIEWAVWASGRPRGPLGSPYALYFYFYFYEEKQHLPTKEPCHLKCGKNNPRDCQKCDQ